MTAFRDVALTERVDQGDVFQDLYFPAVDANVLAVVITPTCDLEHEKAHFIKFVSTVALDLVIRIIADSVGINDSLFDSGSVLSKTKLSQLMEMFKRNTRGDFLPRYYLLTEYSGFPASYLDFQQIFVIPIRQVYEEYLSNRVARVESPWREQIVVQYSGYSMRVGVPDYSDDKLRDLLVATGLNLPLVSRMWWKKESVYPTL